MEHGWCVRTDNRGMRWPWLLLLALPMLIRPSLRRAGVGPPPAPLPVAMGVSMVFNEQSQKLLTTLSVCAEDVPHCSDCCQSVSNALVAPLQTTQTMKLSELNVVVAVTRTVQLRGLNCLCWTLAQQP